ncbi:N-acetylglucosamine kinase [Enterococcus canis]|uniref:N-acetylglucosamine kinase n=1 Tax=Enterococcus canis TaxID=214095 RepID=UPI0008332665|nr:BadF/BadG/BcrA/BcrD ATPase family protein [Enterococcus canis]
MNFIICGDCGGTKSVFSAYTNTGDLINEIISGPGNVVADKSGALDTITESLAKLLTQLNGECQAIILGIAGLDTSGYEEELQQKWSRFGIPLFLMNDAKLALYAKLKGEDGALLISGTGSVGYLKYKGQFFRAGGWGHILGDEGSGYWLGKQAYKQVVEDIDRRMITPFTSAFIKWLGFSTPTEAVRQFYHLNKEEVANAAVFVAGSQTETALKLQQQAGKHLAQLIDFLCVNHNEPIVVALTGSVLEKNEKVRAALREHLAIPKTTLIVSETPITLGGWYYWKEQR